jgi:hypothetical protein
MSKARHSGTRPASIGIVVAAWCAVGLVAAGCSGNPIKAPPLAPVGAPTPVHRAVACAVAAREIAAMWDPASNGFSDVPTFAQAPSLYRTSWSVQLAARAGVKLPGLDRAAVTRWLLGYTSRPGSHSVDTGLDTVTRVNLVVATLNSLGERPPRSLLDALAPLRSGGLYRSKAGAPPNWPATYLAVQALSGAGLPVPPEVGRAALAAARGVLAATSVQVILGQGIPALDVLIRARVPLPVSLQSLQRTLTTWQAQIAKLGPFGPGLGALVAIHEMAQRAAVPLPRVPSAFFTQLRTPSGYYSFSPRLTQGDPQVSFDAVTLGAVLPAAAHSTIGLGMVAQGWLGILSRPSILSTFQAVFADRACGILPHPREMTGAIRSWLASVAGQGQGSAGSSQGSPDDMGRVCWLASAYGVAVSRQDAAKISGGVLTAIRLAAHAAPPGGAQPGMALVDAQDCHVNLGAAMRSEVEASLQTAQAQSAADAFNLYTAGRLLHDQSLVSRAVHFFTRLRAGQAFRFRSGQKNPPDLISTGYGLSVTPAASGRAASSMSAAFSTPWGPALLMPAPAHSGQAPVVDLASLAFGIAMGSGTSPAQPLI